MPNALLIVHQYLFTLNKLFYHHQKNPFCNSQKVAGLLAHFDIVDFKELGDLQTKLVACIKGTKSQDIIDVLAKLPIEKRKLVKEITLDMANNMQLVSKMSFPENYLVTGRFHVVKLVMEALQHLGIKYRWEEIEKENQAIKIAKEQGLKYIPSVFENDDTPKQLLARSRYIIAKKSNDWTENQKVRAELLFENYPLLHQAYKHTMEFKNIYEETSRALAKEKILNWIEKTKLLEMTVFNTVATNL